jgi:hypothetical protein
MGLLLTIPYAGPLLCILTHAAAPLALVELMLDGGGGGGGGSKRGDDDDDRQTATAKQGSMQGMPTPSAPPAVEDEEEKEKRGPRLVPAVIGDEGAKRGKDKAS